MKVGGTKERMTHVRVEDRDPTGPEVLEIKEGAEEDRILTTSVIIIKTGYESLGVTSTLSIGPCNLNLCRYTG